MLEYKSMNIIKYLFDWRYRYFRDKLKAVKCSFEDIQFKKFKTLEIREEVRQEYTLQKTRLEVLENQIKSQKEIPTMEKGEIARLDDEKERTDKKIEQLKEQVATLDTEVHGSRPTEQYRDGLQGLDQTLDAYRELQKMILNYMKTL